MSDRGGTKFFASVLLERLDADMVRALVGLSVDEWFDLRGWLTVLYDVREGKQ